MKKFLAASLCMFVVAACAMGGAKKSAFVERPSTQTPGEAGAPNYASPKDQLDRLYAQVEEDRQHMELPEPQAEAGTPAMPVSSAPSQTSKTDPTCKPAPSDTCQTSCKLSDSICENTDKICKLASELQPDDDATAKCTKSTKTCKSSHQKCCGCML